MYASDTYDVGGAEMDHTVLHFLDSEEKLIGISLAEDKIRTIWFDERFQKYQDDLDKYRPNHTNRILDWSDDGKIILVKSYSDTDPGRYSIFNPEQMKMFTVAENNVELRESKLSPTQIIRFQARDGYELQGYLNLPTYRGDTPSRLVVMPHGGPFARDHWRFDPWVQFFATRGYGVLRVNFRGSTGFGRNHLLAGIRKLDSTMVDDIADGALWAVEHGHADAGEVYIFGHSYGGYAALMSAIRHPDIYQAAVAWSAPTDLVEQLKSHKKNKEYFAYEYWRTVVGDPRKERQTLARISPVNNIKSIGIPVLLFHGQISALGTPNSPQQTMTRRQSRERPPA